MNLPDWQHILSELAHESRFESILSEVFGPTLDRAIALQIQQAWQRADFSGLPEIVMLPGQAMPQAMGGYARSTQTIYLNQDWVAGARESQVIAVLLEELGHHLDNVLNPVDTPGDEGKLFAARVLGIELSEAEIAALRAADDRGVIWVDGQMVAVEMATLVTTPIPRAAPGRTHQELHNGYAFAALKSDGSVVTWGAGIFGGDSSAVANQLTSNVTQIFSNSSAFAALKTDGSVVTWGGSGGNSSAVSSQLSSGVTQIFSTVSAFAALKSDGSVVTWGSPFDGGDRSGVITQLSSGVTHLFSTYHAFAALKSDGSLVTWGNADNGGNSSTVANRLNSGVLQVFSTSSAFAAVKSDGSVVTWGNAITGGNSGTVAHQLGSGVTQIFSTFSAFAALKNDGSVVTWGFSGGNSSAVAAQLSSGVVQVFSTVYAFAALKDNGSVITWGDASRGGSSSAVAAQLGSGVTQIFSTATAFAALKNDGSVVTWGEGGDGGDSSAVAAQLISGVTQIFSTGTAFAALKADGSVITWGRASDGGDSSAVVAQLSSGVTQIFSTSFAFAALKSDGSVVTWGDTSHGGDSSAVANQLQSGVMGLATPFTDDRLILPTHNLAILSGHGQTSLLKDGDQYLYAQGNQGIPIPVVMGNDHVRQTSYAGWQPLAAETINGTNQLLWKHGPSQSVAYWSFDTNWAFSAASELWHVNSPQATALETRFGVDANGDGVVGTTFTSLSTQGQVSLLKDLGGHLYAQGNQGPGAFSIAMGLDPVRETSYAGWQPLAAETINGTNQLLWKHSPSQSVAYWSFDANWTFSAASELWHVNSPQAAALETRFGVDANGDGVVGTTFTSLSTQGQVSLLKDLGGHLYAQANNGTPIPVVMGNDHVRETSYAGWQPLAAETINGTNQLLWKHGPSQSVAYWSFDANWTFTAASELWHVNSPQAAALETRFGVDANGDGVVGTTFTSLSTQGQVSLLKDLGGHLYAQANNGTPIPVVMGNDHVRETSYAGWQPLAAETINGTNQLLWKHGPSQSVAYWSFDANWTFTTASELWHVNSPQAAALETRFGVDANGDGVVGPIFSPTAQEQYMLELINRARANPLGEVARNSDVFDLNQGLAAGTITSDAKQPLAFNVNLINAARGHSQWMLDADIFSHTGVGGSVPHDRMVAAGYQFTGGGASGENISWRGTTGTPDINTYIGIQHDGLFTSAGHRTNLMDANFREIGVGALVGEFTRTGISYNAVMVTQNFAKSGNDVFLTGVVYNDSVFADNFYTIGEGIGGITIQAVSSDGQVFTTTSFLSGGYTLALQPSTYTVNFSGGSLTQPVSTVVNLSSSNVKLDLNTGQLNFAVQGHEQLTQSGEERDELIGYEVKSQTVSLAADPLTEATSRWVADSLLSSSLGDMPSIGYDVLTKYQAGDAIEFEDIANNQWVNESIDEAKNLSAIEELFGNHGLSAGSTQAFTVNGYEDTFLALNDHALGLKGTAMPLSFSKTL